MIVALLILTLAAVTAQVPSGPPSTGATTACTTAADCNGNGACTSNICVCDFPWSGEQCDDLNLVNFQCSGAEPNVCSCAGNFPVLDGATKQCRDRQESDCTGTALPFFDATTTPKTCRVWQIGDCSGATPVFVDGTTGCRARVASDCTIAAGTPVLDDGLCRAWVEEDCCTDQGCGKPVFVDGTQGCRELIGADCAKLPATPFFDSSPKQGNPICRAYVASDCDSLLPMFVSGTGGCRARIASDCTGSKPVLDGGECRERKATDCTEATKPNFDEKTRTCESQVMCALTEEDFTHVGDAGDCKTTGLAAGTSCMPKCETGLASSGEFKCSTTGIIENTFECMLELSIGLSGLTPDDFSKDPVIADVFKTTVAQLSGATVSDADVRNVVASAPGVDSTSTAKVTFSIKMSTANQQMAVKEAVSTALADGGFTAKYKENLETSAVTSIDVEKVSADSVQQENPPTEPEGGDGPDGPDGPNSDTTGDGGDDSGGGTGGGIGIAIGALFVVVGVVGAVWYFKFRKPSDSVNMTKLESPKKDVSNPLNFQSSSDVELEAPTQSEGGPVVTTNSGATFVTDK